MHSAVSDPTFFLLVSEASEIKVTDVATTRTEQTCTHVHARRECIVLERSECGDMGPESMLDKTDDQSFILSTKDHAKCVQAVLGNLCVVSSDCGHQHPRTLLDLSATLILDPLVTCDVQRVNVYCSRSTGDHSLQSSLRVASSTRTPAYLTVQSLKSPLQDQYLVPVGPSVRDAPLFTLIDLMCDCRD